MPSEMYLNLITLGGCLGHLSYETRQVSMHLVVKTTYRNVTPVLHCKKRVMTIYNSANATV